MKLAELLSTRQDDRRLYICARNGAIMTGTAAEILAALPDKDRECAENAENKLKSAQSRYEYYINSFGDDDRRTKKAKAYLEGQAPYIPLPERVVTDTYDRTTEEATNICITGDEQGKIWSVKEGTEDWIKIELNYNVEELAGAVIKSVIEDYKHAFWEEIGAYMDLMKALQEYRNKSEEWERWFRSPRMQAFTSFAPEYFINKAREYVINEIEERMENAERETLESAADGNEAEQGGESECIDYDNSTVC